MINGPGVAFVERDRRMAAVDVPELTTESRRAGGRPGPPARWTRNMNTEPTIDARIAPALPFCGPPAAPTAGITNRRSAGRAFTVEELTGADRFPPRGRRGRRRARQ